MYLFDILCIADIKPYFGTFFSHPKLIFMRKIWWFFVLIFSTQISAQTFPITSINISLPANPDTKTANWGTGSSMFTITANARTINGKIDDRVRDCKILVVIKKNGSKICGSNTGNTAPLANFNTSTKVWSGANATSLLAQECTLPAGDYELCVQFFVDGAIGTTPISEEKRKQFTIKGPEQINFQSPQNISPVDGTIISESDMKKPITFRWTPLVPKPQEPTTYRLKVWQLMQGQTGAQAMRTNQPIITKDVDNITQAVVTNIITGPCKPPYLCDFVWNVQAVNKEGKTLGNNDGTSEASMFSANSCDVNLILKLKSVECLPATNGANNYKICMSATYNSSTYNLTYTNAGSGFKAYNPSFTLFYGISNITPALQVQNNGTTTTVNYCFDVIVTAGQTAIKIGLQGDDKDPGPIVCQPGAELDVQLPNCKVECKCGTWNPLTVETAAGAKRYDCGSTIKWSCKTPFQFTSSYQCSPNDKTCEAKTTWEVKKGDQIIKSGTGTTNLKDGFSLMANGTYTLTLNANCGDKDCPPCIYTIVVEDCRPDITCDCGKWNPLTVETLAGAKRYDCGSTIKWSCKTPFQFTSSYQCSPNDKTCEAKTTWEVKKGTTVIKSGTGTNTLSDGFSLMANGTYTLTLNANCGDKDCQPCIYTIVVEDCLPVLSCVTPPNDMVAWWTFDEKSGQPLVDRAGVNNVGTGINNPLSVPAKVAGGLKFNGTSNYVDVPNHAELNFGTGNFSFDAWIQTDDATIIRPIIDKRSISIGYSIFLYKGKLSIQLNDSGPNTNYVSTLFVADGKWHHIAITVARANKKGIIFYLDGVPTQLGDPTLRPGNLDNTEPLLIARSANDWDNNGNKIHFKGILDEIELFKGVLNPAEVQALYAAGSAGKCKDVPPPPPVCDCGKWNPLTVETLAGAKRYDCGSTIPWSCKTPFKFTSSYQCNPNTDNCKSQVKWTITKDGNPYSSGTGTTGAFTPTANGTYIITLEADCNGVKCPPCIYTVVVTDCSSLNCECSNDMYVIATPGGLKIRCKETKIFDYGTTITLVPQNICNPADCLLDWTIKVFDLQTGAFITSGSGTGSTSSFVLTLNSLAGYRIEVTGNCNGKKCVCTFYIRTKNTPQACGCGTWKDNTVAFTSNTSGCVISGSVKCKKGIRLLPGIPYTFTSPVYNCNLANDTCQPVYSWSVNGIPQGTGSTLTYTFSAANNQVSIKTNCGGKACDSCVFEVILPAGPCDSTLNQVMYDSASFISSLSSSQLINFSTNDNGTPMSNPSADFALSCYTWNGITFSDARSYWNLLIYGGVIKIAFPPGMYKKAGFEMSQFYGNNGNVTVKVYSGNCVYTYTRFADASLPHYFGINLPVAIDKIEVSHSISPVVIDNFRFGN